MTVLLLSIRPQAAQQILQGSKSYEYRRCCPSKTVTTLLLYVTAPVQRVVASVEVLSCLQGTPEQLWQQTAAGAELLKNRCCAIYRAAQEPAHWNQALYIVLLYQKHWKPTEYAKHPVLLFICRKRFDREPDEVEFGDLVKIFSSVVKSLYRILFLWYYNNRQ